MTVHLIGNSPFALRNAIPHSHEYWEIVLNTEGDGITTIGKQQFEFHPGTIICHPPDTLHSKSSEEKFRDIFVGVSKFPLSPNGKVLVFNDDDQKTFETLMTLALRTFHKREDNYIAIVNSLYNAMYQKLVGWNAGNCTQNTYVEQLKNKMIENFTDPEFKLSRTTKDHYYCNDHFRRCFKKETGLTPIAYLTMLRMEYAKKLLTSLPTNRSFRMSELALMSGFYDYHYFTKVFKKYSGMTPTEFAAQENEFEIAP